MARVWDAATGEPVTPPLQHASWLYAAVFSPDGRHVVTASNDHTAQVWDAANGQRVGPALKHADEVRSAAFSPNGRLVVTASEDRTAQLWEAALREPLDRQVANPGVRLEFRPVGVREMVEVRAAPLVALLRPHMHVFYDESGAIGRRYRRQDEIGTPFGITVDFETLGEKDPALRDTVTLRDRDSMKQERVAIQDLPATLRERIS